MKKIISVLLVLCTLLSLAACGSSGKKSGGGEDSPKIKAWAFHSFEKTIVNIAPKGTLKTDYTVYLAKGETEGCQVAIYSDTMIKNVMLTLKSGETELIKPTMYVMSNTHKIGKKYYTDGLVPYGGIRVTVEPKIILPFMIFYL